MTEIAVVVPVLGRPQRAAPLVASLTETTPQHLARLLFVCSLDDRAQLEACRATGCETLLSDDPRWAPKINLGYRETGEPFLLLAADDLRFHLGWAEAALELFATSDVGVVGTNDLGNPTVKRGLHSTHPLVCRGYADRHGTVDGPGAVVAECYQHNWVDAELVETAKARGCWAFAAESVVEHCHPFWHKGADDATYELGRAGYRADQALFTRRRRLWTRGRVEA